MEHGEVEKVIEEKIAEAKKNQKIRVPRGWVKLTSDGWLHGSINYRMEPDQICVFSKLIVMGDKFGPVPGLISDNNYQPLPHEYLAHQACCTVELFESTLSLAITDGSVYENSHGIYMINFDKYQFTEYDRQKPYRQEKKKLEQKDPHRLIKEKNDDT